MKMVSGNLLEATENVICHQVNLAGIFGGGLALQIKNKYPECENETQLFIDNTKEYKMGMVCFYIAHDHIIANCFSQNYKFETDYSALEKCVAEIKKQFPTENVAIPYKYGCGIAIGDWNKVLKIWEKYFPDVVVYKLEEK